MNRLEVVNFSSSVKILKSLSKSAGSPITKGHVLGWNNTRAKSLAEKIRRKRIKLVELGEITPSKTSKAIKLNERLNWINKAQNNSNIQNLKELGLK